MGLLIAAVFIVGAALGSAKHEGVLKKGADTTYRDTVTFEQYAAEQATLYNGDKAARLQKEMDSWENLSPKQEDRKEKKAPDIQPGV